MTKPVNINTYPAGVLPEHRVLLPRKVALDLSPEDLRLQPNETGGPRGGSTPARLLARSTVADLLADLLTRVGRPGDRVLLFEPTRPDLRLAVLRCGLAYVDGGRLLDGRPDPAVLDRVRPEHFALTLIEADDPRPPAEGLAVLVDGRSAPWRPGAAVEPTPGLWTLRRPGLRDGFDTALGAWIEGEGGIAPTHPSAGPASSLGTRTWTSDPSFGARARRRWEAQEEALRSLCEAAVAAGFEARSRAGFLWMGRAGLSSAEMATALAGASLGAFACDHHTYRHRIRLAPPPLSHLDEARARIAAAASACGA